MGKKTRCKTMCEKDKSEFYETVRFTIPHEALETPQAVGAPSRQKAVRARKQPFHKRFDSKEYAVYKQFMDNIYDAVIITDWSGAVLDVNSRVGEFFNGGSDELCRLSVFDLFYRFDNLTMERVRKHLDKGNRFILIDAYCRRCDGSIFSSEIASHTMKIGNESFVCFFVRDMTRRNQTEQSLAEAREQLAKNGRLDAAGRVAGRIAHDFNNLLTPLRSYPSLIKKHLPEDSQARKDLETMEQVAQSMADINQQLLMISRRGYFNKQPVRLNMIIKTLMQLLRRDSNDNIEVRMELAENLFNVPGAEEQLMRLVQNLYHNAVAAMEGSGSLTVKTENVYIEAQSPAKHPMKIGEYVKLSIIDTGCGIPAEMRDKIFEPFFTTHKYGAKHRGAGLGMSIVYSIVKDHNGYIEIVSEVGHGTTFIIYLPAERRPSDGEMPKKFSAREAETILVVDDDEVQIDVLTKILNELGYRVFSARSGEEAVALQENSKESGAPPDLVVLDVMLGNGIDGAETYQCLEAINPGQKAVFISGYEKTAGVESIQSAGGGAFLKKPVDAAELGKVIRRELDKPGVAAD